MGRITDYSPTGYLEELDRLDAPGVLDSLRVFEDCLLLEADVALAFAARLLALSEAAGPEAVAAVRRLMARIVSATPFAPRHLSLAAPLLADPELAARHAFLSRIEVDPAAAMSRTCWPGLPATCT